MTTTYYAIQVLQGPPLGPGVTSFSAYDFGTYGGGDFAMTSSLAPASAQSATWSTGGAALVTVTEGPPGADNGGPFRTLRLGLPSPTLEDPTANGTLILGQPTDNSSLVSTPVFYDETGMPCYKMPAVDTGVWHNLPLGDYLHSLICWSAES